MRAAFPGTILCLAIVSGCVSFQYLRRNLSEPVPDHLWRTLPAGSDLAIALARLGAPYRVVAADGGTALIWTWGEEVDWGLSISVPVSDLSASYRYASTDAGLHAVRILYDERWRMVAARRGFLRDFLGTEERQWLEVEEGQQRRR